MRVCSVLNMSLDFTWIGWPGWFERASLQYENWFHHLIQPTGLDVPESEREGLSKRLMEEHSCSPVFLSDEIADRHYNGFSNSILWPLFHYRQCEVLLQCRTYKCSIRTSQITIKCSLMKRTGWHTEKPMLNSQKLLWPSANLVT